MMVSRWKLLLAISTALAPLPLWAGCEQAVTDAAVFDASRAAAEVQVLSAQPYEAGDGTIRTRYDLNAIEVFKGDLPQRLTLSTPGGELPDRGDSRSDGVLLTAGSSYILMFTLDPAGGWHIKPFHAYRGGPKHRDAAAFFRGKARGQLPKLVVSSSPDAESSSASSVFEPHPGNTSSVTTTTGYLETGGQPIRWAACDGGDSIPYVVDVDPTKLPTGMTQQDALNAVAEALQAWSAVSSLKFRYEGTASFGVAASTISAPDRRIRIQLHDNFNAINQATTPNTLGIGGGHFQPSTSLAFTGGKIGSQGFQELRNGYVVIESSPKMTEINQFKRVLTHELGHALGLAHSSENASEPNATLKNATMYYATSTGTAGATIQSYDVGKIQFGYSATNTPPFTIDRVFHSVTTNSGSLPSVLGCNRLAIRAFDRQGTALTVSLTASTNLGNGSFSLSGNQLIFTPAGNIGDTALTGDQIEGGTYFEKAFVQFSDGVNLSRAAICTLTGFENDTSPSDGMPDIWMNANFNTTTPGAIGSNRHPDSDPDKDGLSNRLEWYLGSNPNDANSGLMRPVYDAKTRRLSGTPLRFAPYWVESATTLNSWTLRRYGTVYQASDPIQFDFAGEAQPAKEFYRIGTSF